TEVSRTPHNPYCKIPHSRPPYWQGVMRNSLITVPELSAEALGSFLAEHLHRNFGSTHAHLAELIPSIARIALECIGNSDALYHNVEHTMLVTLVGYDIMRGRAL